MCPFSKSRFKSKSYSAYRLKEGMNWSQFLGLGPIANTKKAMALPEDSDPPMGTMIKLPKFSGLESMRPPQATVATGGSVRLKDSEGRQLLSDLDDGTAYYPQGDGLLEEPITVVTNGKHDVTHSDVQVEEQETIQEKSIKPKTKRYNKIQIDTPHGERIDFGGH